MDHLSPKEAKTYRHAKTRFLLRDFQNLAAGLSFVSLAIGLVMLHIYDAYRVQLGIFSTINVTGVVREKHDDRRHELIYSYKLQDGKTRYKNLSCIVNETTWNSIFVSDTIPVTYLEKDPKTHSVNNPTCSISTFRLSLYYLMYMCAIPCLFIGVYLTRKAIKRSSYKAHIMIHAKKADAVIRHIRKRTTKYRTDYILTYIFSVDGTSYRGNALYYAKPDEEKGDHINIYYDPEDPTRNLWKKETPRVFC